MTAAAVLMVVIIALLAALWVRERSGRIAAQQNAIRWELQFKNLRGALGNLLPPGAQKATRPVVREDLPSKVVELDGRTARLLEVSASAGRRFGFRQGDLILVRGEPPTTQPRERR